MIFFKPYKNIYLFLMSWSVFVDVPRINNKIHSHEYIILYVLRITICLHIYVEVV